MQHQFSIMAAIFVTLALVYLVLVLATSPGLSSSAMTLVSAVFGGTLAFILVRVFQLAEELRWGR